MFFEFYWTFAHGCKPQSITVFITVSHRVLKATIMFYEKELTEMILGCAYKVHTGLGPGLLLKF